MGDNSVDTCKIKITQNGATEKKEYDEFTPPDGGTRSWLVMLGSFFCNGILFGVINSYSILYNSFHDNLERQNVTDATSKAGQFDYPQKLVTPFQIDVMSEILSPKNSSI